MQANEVTMTIELITLHGGGAHVERFEINSSIITKLPAFALEFQIYLIRPWYASVMGPPTRFVSKFALRTSFFVELESDIIFF